MAHRPSIWICALMGCALSACGDTRGRPGASGGSATAGGGAGQASAASGGGSGVGGLQIEVPEPRAEGGAAGSSTIAQIPTRCEETGKSSIGCDFFSVPPRGARKCFAAFIVNVQSEAVTIGLERDGVKLDAASLARIPRGGGQTLTYEPLPDGKLPGNEVAIISLADYGGLDGCPVDPGARGEPFIADGTGRGHAFHLSSSLPVAAYDMSPFGGGTSEITSATLLLPTPAWHTNYVAVAPSPGQGALQIVAREDDTAVTIAPSAEVKAGSGVEAAPKGVPTTYRLARGEVLQLVTAQSEHELTGSPIVADKPVAVWGSSACFAVPEGAGACDSAHQQIPPVNALGSEYVTVRYRNRDERKEEPFLLRLVGAVDETSLRYEPAPPPGAPTTVASGQSVDFYASEPLVIRSQDADHPFYVGSYMTGCSKVNLLNCIGDPEFVNVIPAQQYLSSYVFFTDPTYPDTNLVLVRRRHEGRFHDVTLDCAGNIGGFQPVGDGAQYEFARVDLVRGNFEAQGNCDNGRHELKSDGPVGLTVWGWGSADTLPRTDAVSYAYPGGTGIVRVNDVFVPTVVK